MLNNEPRGEREKVKKGVGKNREPKWGNLNEGSIFWRTEWGRCTNGKDGSSNSTLS